MTKYQSELIVIKADQIKAFETLSSPLKIRELIYNAGLSEKLNGFDIINDSIVFSNPAVGNIIFRLKETNKYSSIQYQTENSPLTMNLEIELSKVTEDSTNLQLNLTAELPPVIKMMMGSKVLEALDKLNKFIAISFEKDKNFDSA